MFKHWWARAFGASVVYVCLLALPLPAQACSVCGCGDPLVLAGDSVPTAGAFRLALDGEYLTASAASDDNPAASESVVQETLRPVIVWSPFRLLNLVLQVPVTRKDWTLTGGGENAASNNTGLGDVDLGARLFLWEGIDYDRLRRQDVALSFGSSLPTGADDAEVAGERIDDHAQLGTGSFGPYLGGLYAFHQDPWSLTINVSGRIHSTNSFGYRYAAALLWGARATYLVRSWLGLVVGVDGRFAARDVASGETQENTGGFLLAAVPGVSVQLWSQMWLLARAQLPFYSHLFGVQSVGPVVTTSFQYAFN